MTSPGSAEENRIGADSELTDDQPDDRVDVSQPSSGQVTVGPYVVQIGAIHGGVVNIASTVDDQENRLRARQSPVKKLPRPVADILDRLDEVHAITSSLQANQSVEVYGSPGIGKTTLLQFMAHRPVATNFRDGVFFASGRNMPLEDVLQIIFDAFYYFDGALAVKPNRVQLESSLSRLQALIILDDLNLQRADVEDLLAALPNSAFLIASKERCLWGRGSHSIGLSGLPLEDAVALMERQIGRQFSDDERTAIIPLVKSVEANPLSLLRLAALMRFDNVSVEQLSEALLQAPSEQSLITQSVSSLTEQERAVLSALQALGNAPIDDNALTSLTGVKDVARILERLRKRGLIT